MKTVLESGVFEPEVMSAMATVLSADCVALDVGANIGVLTVVLARLCERGTVFAFEPGREAAEYLRRNIQRNGFTNVVVEETAVLDVTGRVVLEVDAGGSAWSYVSTLSHSEVPEDVATVRLDDWMRERNPSRVDLVKLDIESSELRALDGARELLARFRPIVIAEYNPLIFIGLQGQPPGVLYRALRRYSPSVFALLPGGAPVSVTSQHHLDMILSRHGFVNLLANPVRAPKRGRRLADLARGLKHHLELRRDHNWFQRPELAWFTTTAVRMQAPSAVHAIPASTIDVPVVITNRSSFWLTSDYEHIPIYCGHRWFTAAGAPVGMPPEPQSLPEKNVHHVAIRPRAKATVHCHVPLPTQPGSYVLRFGIVQAHFLWIDDIDPASGATVNVDVSARIASLD